MDKSKVVEFRKREKAKENSIDSKVNQGEITVANGSKTYRNNYFALEINVPEFWITMDSDGLIALARENFSKLNIPQAERDKLLQSMTSDTVSLFRSTPYPAGTKQAYGESGELDNPVINCTAQKVTMYPNWTAKDFVEDMTEHLKNGSMGIAYDKVSDIVPVIIGGSRFEFVEGKAVLNGGKYTVSSRYYSLLKKGYQLSIIATCMSEEGYRDLSNIINTLIID